MDLCLKVCMFLANLLEGLGCFSVFDELPLIILLGFLGNTGLTTEVLLVKDNRRGVLLNIFFEAVNLSLEDPLLVLEFTGLFNFTLLELGQFLVGRRKVGDSSFEPLLKAPDPSLDIDQYNFKKEDLTYSTSCSVACCSMLSR